MSTITACLAALLAAIPAAAGDIPKPKGACGESVVEFCKGVQAADIGACLRRNEAKVAEACRQEMNKAPAGLKVPKPKGVCGEFVLKFCKDAEGEDIGACLKSNEKKLSAACREQMNKKPENLRTPKPKGACAEFVLSYCRGAEGKDIGECLKRNEKKVSAACLKEMSKRSPDDEVLKKPAKK
jgi:hypothetical protein